MDLPAPVVRVLPNSWTYGDRLTTLTRRLLRRAALGALGIAVGLAALVLVNATNWREVLAGAVLAWGTAMVTWAVSSHRRERHDIVMNLRCAAEVDLLHARLNHITHHLGLPTINLAEMGLVTMVREERLAAWSDVPEFRPDLQSVSAESGWAFWDTIAQGEEPPADRIPGS